MMLQHIPIVASLGLIVGAFMIPSTTSLHDFESETAGNSLGPLRIPDDFINRFENLHDGVIRLGSRLRVYSQADEHIQIALPCEDCVALVEALNMHQQESQSPSLHLLLDISPIDNALKINEYQVFPPTERPQPISALAIMNGIQEQYEGSLEYVAGARTINAADGTKSKLVDLQIRITSFNSIPVGVGAISIRMLNDETGKSRLVQVISISTQDLDGVGMQHDEIRYERMPAQQDKFGCATSDKLTSTICGWRQLISEKLNTWRYKSPISSDHNGSLRPCGHRFGETGRFQGRPRLPLRGGPAKFSSRYHSGHSYEHHTMGRVTHSFAMSLHFLFRHALFPVGIAAVACVVSGIIGQIVGTLIAWVWIKVVRGGKRGGASSRHPIDIAPDTEKVVFNDSKENEVLEQRSTFESTEALPKYVEKE